MLYSPIVEKSILEIGYFALAMTEFEFIGWKIEDEDFLYFMENPERIQIMRLGTGALIRNPLDFMDGVKLYHPELYEKYKLLIE